MATELKTLQDIDGDDDCGYGISHVRRDNLRQEAKKWYHRSDGNKHKFIKEFFNIPEEELNHDAVEVVSE